MTDDSVGIHEQCSRSTDGHGSELKVRSVAGGWVHLECSACALEVSIQMAAMFAAAAHAQLAKPKGGDNR